ncbi:MAG: hypothetical protein QM762_07870 [Chryseolinea sp.]
MYLVTLTNTVARIASIFLLSAFVLHLGGYYFISLTWRQYARMTMDTRIENESYNTEETITLKLPFTLPYAPADGKFESAHGSFEYNGEFYKLVKQKLEGDTLYVVVIKDVKEKMIFGYMSDFVKESSDVDGSKAFKLLTEFTKDYFASVPVVMVSQYGWSYEIGYTVAPEHASTPRIAVESPPPDVA